MLCGACSAGRPDDCSGWCGIEVPPQQMGPWPESVWEDLRAIDCFVDPWAEE